MSFWPDNSVIEGTAEPYLRWRNLAMILVMFLTPLAVAIAVKSYLIKAICWGLFLLTNAALLKRNGPCITALFVTVVSWYLYLQWFVSKEWLIILPVVISLIELSYLRHRMSFISRYREDQDISV